MHSKQRRPLRAAMSAACALLAALFALASHATTKVDDGFTTGFVGDGEEAKPANSVASVRQGSDVYYWVEWTDHPNTPPTLRCVITDRPGGDPLIDHTEAADEAETEGFTVCGMETNDEDFEPGTFYFAQYIDGELVGEKSISVGPRFQRTRRSMYKEFKYWLGVLAVIVLAIGWVMRKMGKVRDGPLDPPLVPEKAKKEGAREALAIGARVAEGIAAQGGGIELPKDNAGEIAKSAALYQALMKQGDKARALEAGRRHLGLLVKDRRMEEAVKAFRECVALDPGFRPERGEDVLPIARAARAAGDPNAAVAVLRGFDKLFPGNAAIPEVYVFSARLMAEDLANADMARKILEHVLQKYPGHFVAQEAKKYLQSMPQSA